MATPPELRIGVLATRTGTTPPTIRYYEDVGLLPCPARQSGGQRRYGEDAVRRLTFIRRCRDFGFSVEQVRMLVELVDDPNRDCIEARDVAQAHLEAIRAKLAELTELEATITGFIYECDTRCVGGPGARCVPLTQLINSDQPRAVGVARVRER